MKIVSTIIATMVTLAAKSLPWQPCTGFCQKPIPNEEIDMRVDHMRKKCLLNSHDTKQNIEAHNEQYNIDKALIFNEEIQEFLSFLGSSSSSSSSSSRLSSSSIPSNK